MSRNPVHLLYPNKVCHKPEEIVRLLRAEFAFVHTDTEKADAHVQGMIDRFSPDFPDGSGLDV